MANAHVTASGYDRKMQFSGVVTEQKNDNGLTLSLTVIGKKNRQKKPFERPFTITLAKGKDRYTGTYTGSADGKDVSGTVVGTFAEEGVSPVLVYGEPDTPKLQALPNGVKIGETEVTFSGGIDDKNETVYVSVSRSGTSILTLTGADVDMNRFQGDIGIFIPDAGYPFGVIPDWLLKQRTKKPEWYEESWPPTQ